MQIAVLGIDLGKNSCSIVGLDVRGAVVLRRRLRREGIIKLAAKLQPCVVAIEACCGAHHLGRVLRAQGHEVRLMSPEYVRPYVKSQKNDDRDAEAIAEAATRPTMRFVELKSEEQLDMQTLHRARDRLVGERTALINQLRAVPRQVTTGGKPRLVGISKRGNKYLRKLLIHGARAALPTLLESPSPLGGWLRGLIARMHKNAAVVALANKLARIAWAVLRHGETFSIEVSTTA